MLDNKQREQLLKFRCFRSSNNFVKVTGRTSKECTVSETNLGEEDNKQCVLTYVYQVIFNLVQFPVFKQEVTDHKSISQIYTSLMRKNLVCESPTKIDITGNRVGVYFALINVSSTIAHTIKPLLTRYNATTTKYKTWNTNRISTLVRIGVQ